MPIASACLSRSLPRRHCHHPCHQTVQSGRKQALGRRLYRQTRHLERLERHVTMSNEALALFVRFWRTATTTFAGGRRNLPRKPKAANAVREALGRRLAKGQSLTKEPSLDVEPAGRQSEGIRIFVT